MLPHRPRVADRSAGVVFSPLRAVGRDTLPTGVVSIRQRLEVMPTMLPHRPRVAGRSAMVSLLHIL